MTTFLPVTPCLDYCCFAASFENESVNPPTLFFLKFVLSISAPLNFLF